MKAIRTSTIGIAVKTTLTTLALPLAYNPKAPLRRLTRALLLLINNPQVFLRILKSKLEATRPLPDSIVRDLDGVLFEFKFDRDPAIKEMYLGTYEVTTVELMKQFLRPGGTFIDVGANIGYLSAIAAGLVGKTGSVHAFEPIPEYFAALNHLATTNDEYNLVPNEYALGESHGTARIDVTCLPNIGYNTLVPHFMKDKARKYTIDVAICRLDNYIHKHNLDNIVLIKIDTEGYEFPILKGLTGYFETSKCRPPIICEINPGAYPLMGYTVGQLVEYMRRWKYHAVSVFNTQAEVDITTLKATSNVLFQCRH